VTAWEHWVLLASTQFLAKFPIFVFVPDVVNNLVEKLIWKGLVRFPDARYIRDSYLRAQSPALAICKI
jgi:hypothetical protein